MPGVEAQADAEQAEDGHEGPRLHQVEPAHHDEDEGEDQDVAEDEEVEVVAKVLAVGVAKGPEISKDALSQTRFCHMLSCKFPLNGWQN